MRQERWDRIAALFAEALERPAAERGRYLEASCPEPELRREVLAMLAAHADAGELRVERRLASHDPAPEAGSMAPGTRVGPYRLEALVGRGGMGEVYRATRADGEFEQVVALKLLRADAGGTDLVRRFRAERALLARLTHPHIATILDGGTAADGRPYLVLRYVDGLPITDQARGRPLAERLQLCIKVARAVQFAHVRLVVHRDLKPSNILVTASGEPVLLDFGIAKLLDPQAGAEHETRTGDRLLTPAHAAPEQLSGGAITTATDVYGLGTLLFELVTGRRLFAEVASTGGALERAILETPAPLPSALAVADRGRIRGDLDRIVQVALRKEPERRYPSAGALADDLERFLEGRPVAAQPDTWWYRTRRYMRRHQAGVWAAGVVVLLLGVLGWREVAQARRVAAERDHAVRAQVAAEEVLAFLTRLFEQSDPRVVPGGDTLRVTEFLARAEAEAAGLADQPARQMQVLRTLGQVRLSRGDYAAAESLLTVARALAVTALGPDDAEVLRTDRLLALAVRERRGDAVAAPRFAAVLAGMRQRYGATHPDVATAAAELAGVVSAPDSVRALLDTAIAIRARLGGGDSTEIASSLDDLARERGLRGHFAEAVALDEAAFRILRARFPRDHPFCLTVLGNQASWLGQLGRWDRARPLAEEVLAAARRQTSPGEGLALAYERVALIVVNLPGGAPVADSLEREALRVFRATVSPEHGLLTSAMRNHALILGQLGREAAGLALLDSAIARARAAGEAENTAYMTGQRVPLLVRLGRVVEAERSAAAAAGYRDRLPRGSTRAADLEYWGGLAAMAAGRPAEAARQLERAAAQLAARYPEGHPRRAMFECAAGAALGAAGGEVARARALVAAGCPALTGWGMADRTVVAWGEAAARRLDVQIGPGASR
ncbi:MAG: serine/threonine-protein kinase [Gemmatimonadales bacterium]